MATIGFVGLGHMGTPMVLNLLKTYAVTVYDINKAALTIPEQAGAMVCDGSDALFDKDVIITMLQTGQQVEDVLVGSGLIDKIAPGTLLIDCSTIDMVTTKKLHKLALSKQLKMLDAPVSGGVMGAKTAALTFMVGGTLNDFEQASPILSCMGKNIIHAGAAGTGQAAKICNNMLLATSMIGVCEAFTLAEKLGLAPDKLHDISSKSSGQCWSMTAYSPIPGLVPSSPANHDYAPGFTTDMMLKDLKLSQQAADSVDVATPLGADALALYQLFANQGHGSLDFSGILKLIAGKLD